MSEISGGEEYSGESPIIARGEKEAQQKSEALEALKARHQQSRQYMEKSGVNAAVSKFLDKFGSYRKDEIYRGEEKPDGAVSMHLIGNERTTAGGHDHYHEHFYIDVNPMGKVKIRGGLLRGSSTIAPDKWEKDPLAIEKAIVKAYLHPKKEKSSDS